MALKSFNLKQEKPFFLWLYNIQNCIGNDKIFKLSKLFEAKVFPLKYNFPWKQILTRILHSLPLKKISYCVSRRLSLLKSIQQSKKKKLKKNVGKENFRCFLQKPWIINFRFITVINETLWKNSEQFYNVFFAVQRVLDMVSIINH